MSLQGKASANEVLKGRISRCNEIIVSAYEIAVKNGFEGTEEEWLASLKGEKGEPGNVFDDLTEEQKESIKGDKGEDGNSILYCSVEGALKSPSGFIGEIENTYFNNGRPKANDLFVTKSGYVGRVKSVTTGTSSLGTPSTTISYQFVADLNGQDYVLTEADKQEIAGMVEVSGGGSDSNSGQNANLTTAQINALNAMFKVCAFIKDDISAEYNAFKTAFGITDSNGDDSDGDSGESEVTLTSISATYSGGDVTAGTAVTDLTGIVVTAHYSDGTSATVTGYTLSGTIAEGSNTITVSYGGKTTTFTVTGTAESVETNDTTAKIATYGYTLRNNATPIKNEDMCITELYDISDVFDGVTAAYGYVKGSFKYSGITPASNMHNAHLYVDNAYDDYKNTTTIFTTDGTEGQMNFKAETYSGKTMHLQAALQTAYIDDSYLYIAGNGRVIFAGKNTPYYNMSNIDGTPYTP